MLVHQRVCVVIRSNPHDFEQVELWKGWFYMFGLWSWGMHPICGRLECRENEGKLADEMGYHI